ncbi:E3 ubiquitin protein ligase RIN2 [Camellia lanceoleosa]|nr:E3 ubiquitin protein ligase RIN2 [Camellia lanceoleosa]
METDKNSACQVFEDISERQPINPSNHQPNAVEKLIVLLLGSLFIFIMDKSIRRSGNNTNCQRSKLLDISTAGSFCEWKGILIRNLGFLLDIMTLLMALCHYVHIWWLHGMKFHLVDALLGAIVKHIKGFIRLKIALGALHRPLPDATPEEIEAYDDECAICRELMAKAKRLSQRNLKLGKLIYGGSIQRNLLLQRYSVSVL